MCSARSESTSAAETVADVVLTVEQCRGILMAVHRSSPDDVSSRLHDVAREHRTPVHDLATATVELVRGAPPTDPGATVVAMRFLLGSPAYQRAVLDGQVHPSVRDAAADMHPGPDAAVEELLRAADVRDQAAEARDRAARDRDDAAQSRAQGAADTEHDGRDRGQAALDREWAAADRDRSAGDRAHLIDELRHRQQELATD